MALLMIRGEELLSASLSASFCIEFGDPVGDCEIKPVLGILFTILF
jgi:hypothetical protein